jgi:hypothetical protein
MICERIALYGSAIVSEGTLRVDDLLPASLGALRELAPDLYMRLVVQHAPLLSSEPEQDGSEYARADARSWLLEVIAEALSEHAPAGTWFGSHEGDGALIGFWGDDPEGSDEDDYCQANG